MASTEVTDTKIDVEETPAPSQQTAATPQPPTDPTTHSALHQTIVPSCTSIETSLVESDATTT
jgi:hypothetical protein